MLKRLLEKASARKSLPWLLAAGLLFAVGCSKGHPPVSDAGKKAQLEEPAPEAEAPEAPAAIPAQSLKPGEKWDPDSMTPPPPPPIPEGFEADGEEEGDEAE